MLEGPRNPRLSPAGDRVAVIVADDLWVHDVAGRPPIRLTSQDAMFSPLWTPDGRWLAYVTDQTGEDEVWVRPYPGPGAAVRVSPGGGVDPVWARDGRELFYLEGTQLMVVPVSPADGRFDFSPARRLLEFTYVRSSQPPSYDVSPDGRFLVIKAVEGTVRAERPRIVIVPHWLEELKRLVPAD